MENAINQKVPDINLNYTWEAQTGVSGKLKTITTKELSKNKLDNLTFKTLHNKYYQRFTV